MASQELNKFKCCLWTLLLANTTHVLGTPIVILLEEKLKTHPEIIKMLLWKWEEEERLLSTLQKHKTSLQLLSNFVQVCECHTLADRSQQECQRKCSFGFLILPESGSLSPAETPKLIRYLKAICKAKAEVIFVTQTHKCNFISVLIHCNTL